MGLNWWPEQIVWKFEGFTNSVLRTMIGSWTGLSWPYLIIHIWYLQPDVWTVPVARRDYRLQRATTTCWVYSEFRPKNQNFIAERRKKCLFDVLRVTSYKRWTGGGLIMNQSFEHERKNSESAWLVVVSINLRSTFKKAKNADACFVEKLNVRCEAKMLHEVKGAGACSENNRKFVFMVWPTYQHGQQSQ